MTYESFKKGLKKMCNSELLEWYTHYAQFIDYNDKDKKRMYDYFKRAVLERMKGE